MYTTFNVFGKKMSVKRDNDRWLLFRESESGLRARVYDVVIPDDLQFEEIARYLDDIFHEQASDRFPSVFKE